MIKWILLFSMLGAFQYSLCQNLLINPGAESTPLGTAWTVVSTGGTACVAGSAANTYFNWTMTPDNSTNYPSAHGGTKTFFAGCSTPIPAGPFEIFQDINVSADATQIDAGSVTYIFSGYIQTPISPQADAGRFIVDYINTTGAVIGTSYTSVYQSYSGGSGNLWTHYTHTRLAAIGTRKLRVRLQSTVATGPAINAYFDDISIIKTVTLPVVLESFDGILKGDEIRLKWQISDAVDFSRFDLEKSSDTTSYQRVTSIQYTAGQTDYSFENKLSVTDNHVYYRLKMIDTDSRYVYSRTLAFSYSTPKPFAVYPNPATGNIIVTGLHYKGSIIITDMNGFQVFYSEVKNNVATIGTELLKKGIYIISYHDAGRSSSKKLVVR